MSGKRNHAMKLSPQQGETKHKATSVAQSPFPSERVTKKKKLGTFMSQGLVRALGVMLLTLSAAVYLQLVPLTLVMLGGYLGVQPDAGLNNMDTLIWGITGFAVVVPMVWVFIKWVKYIWGRFIVQPLSLFPSSSSN